MFCACGRWRCNPVDVTILIPQVLRSDCDGAAKLDIALSAADGAIPLREVLDEIARRYLALDRRIRDDQGQLRRYVNVFVDSDECRAVAGLDTPVRSGAEIRVLPSVAGG